MDEWHYVERVHSLIPTDEQGPCNYLTLVCTGQAGWAASFDFELAPDWYEQPSTVTIR